jgi:hypothetical protein
LCRRGNRRCGTKREEDANDFQQCSFAHGSSFSGLTPLDRAGSRFRNSMERGTSRDWECKKPLAASANRKFPAAFSGNPYGQKIYYSARSVVNSALPKTHR